jgi:hypothetical protein
MAIEYDGSLAKAMDSALIEMNDKLHAIYKANFAESDTESVGEVTREDVLGAAAFVWSEMQQRGLTETHDSPLGRAAVMLEEGADREEAYARAATEFWEDDDDFELVEVEADEPIEDL